MPSIEHKESHQNDHVDWLRPQERLLLGGEIGVYDARFITLLNELKQERKITTWRRVPDNSPDDREGIDYWVGINNEEIPFQITGRRDGARQRIIKHPDVPAIYFQSRDRNGLVSPEIIKRWILFKAEKFLDEKYRAMWDSYRRDTRRYK